MITDEGLIYGNFGPDVGPTLVKFVSSDRFQ